MAVFVLDLSAGFVSKRRPRLFKQRSAGITVYSIDVTTLCDYTLRPVELPSVRGFPNTEGSRQHQCRAVSIWRCDDLQRREPA